MSGSSSGAPLRFPISGYLIIFLTILCILGRILKRKTFPRCTIVYFLFYTVIGLYVLGSGHNEILCIIPFVPQIIFTLYIILFFGMKNYEFYRKAGRMIFHITNPEKLPKTPAIIIANYPTDFLEYLLAGSLDCKTVLLIFKGGAKYVIPSMGKERVISVDLDKKNNFSLLKNEIKNKVKEGYSIFAYPERDYHLRNDSYRLQNFRTGIFFIAKELNLPIVPIVYSHIDSIVRFPVSKVYIMEPTTIRDKTDIEKIRKKMENKLFHLQFKVV